MGAFRYPDFPYLLYLVSTEVPITVVAKRSVLKGAGWCPPNGPNAECGTNGSHLSYVAEEAEPAAQREIKGASKGSPFSGMFLAGGRPWRQSQSPVSAPRSIRIGTTRALSECADSALRLSVLMEVWLSVNSTAQRLNATWPLNI